MIKYLFSLHLDFHVDEKEEDKSEESKRNHLKYYRSLVNTITNMQEEKRSESEDAIKEHLDKRIQALEEDKKRIRVMFPEISIEEWNDNTK